MTYPELYSIAENLRRHAEPILRQAVGRFGGFASILATEGCARCGSMKRLQLGVYLLTDRAAVDDEGEALTALAYVACERCIKKKQRALDRIIADRIRSWGMKRNWRVN